MARFCSVGAWLLVALWLPATLHCDFELVGFETFFSCESDHHSNSAKPPAEDSCDVVENGWIKLSATQIALSAPLLSACALCFSTPLPVDPLKLPATGLSKDLLAPPEIARTWQFMVRAALPARAPDSVA
ncbi:MAG TPA: hypothetical protein VL069_05530 [Opitutus sp.]|nr:hypothetical protein [Opitutus sp.]